VGLFDNHKAMQSLPPRLQKKIAWATLVSSKPHLWVFGLCLAWLVLYAVMLFLDRHTFWISTGMLLFVIALFLLELYKPRRRLATAFLKLHIRPSHCPCCEYDLRATQGDTCPECGTHLVSSKAEVM